MEVLGVKFTHTVFLFLLFLDFHSFNVTGAIGAFMKWRVIKPGRGRLLSFQTLEVFLNSVFHIESVFP